MKGVYKKISELSKRDILNSEGLALKCVEELGELSVALFQERGIKITEKSLKNIKKNQIEEVCDVMMCLIAILSKKEVKYDEMMDMLSKKIKKYEKTLDKRDKRVIKSIT